jgi:hypothetical protein
VIILFFVTTFPIGIHFSPIIFEIGFNVPRKGMTDENKDFSTGLSPASGRFYIICSPSSISVGTVSSVVFNLLPIRLSPFCSVLSPGPVMEPNRMQMQKDAGR